MPVPTTFLAKISDLATARLIALGAPLARRLGTASRRTPRAQAALDAAGIGIITHHYYSPLVLPGDLRLPLQARRDLPGIDLNLDGQLTLLRELRFGAELREIPVEQTSKTRFAFHNGQFESGDAEILYGMIRHFKPKRVVEIGCGQSTLIALEAQRRNLAEGAPCEHLCVEPFENDWLESTGATILRRNVETIAADLVERLEPNDIFFIDSSHMIRPQGDVLHEYLYLLPKLKPGVVVHVHDIFTPRDYPEQWIVGERRLWNEQYLLEAFLSFNGAFEVLCALNHLWHEHKAELSEAAPLLMREPGREPGSFWMRRKS